MLYKDFEPSIPWPTAEEMEHAYGLLHEAVIHGNETPEEANEIYARMDQLTRERAIFMRDDTKEIVEKMLQDGVPMTLSLMMDMLHVYFWWDLREGEPVDYIEDLLKDLNESQFAEAVEVLHTEFSERCHRHTFNYESESGHCESRSGMECFRWNLAVNKTEEEVKEILRSPSERADKLHMMFFEAIHGEDDEDEYGETPEDREIDDEHYTPMNREPDTHTLQLLLGQHAVQRLVNAGIEDDVEVMDAIAVLELERSMRGQTWDLERYELHRESGGDLESYIQKESEEILANQERLQMLITAYMSPVITLQDLSKSEQGLFVTQYMVEEREAYEQLEILYLLKAEGISPFYRRRMAEDTFPADQRI